MNPFVNESILAEKNINMLPNLEKTTSIANSIPFSNNITTNINSSSEKRLSLTKAYSCSYTSSSDLTEHCLFMTPKQFADLISQNSNSHERKSIPIIDCRSQIDYGCERICSSHNVNCRAKLMAKKLLSKRLEDIDSNLSAVLKNADAVILYDQCTEGRSEDKIRSLPINLVVQAARRSNKKVYILQGGFDAIRKQYPYLIECTAEMPREKCEQDQCPPSPDAYDKENFTMTEILPHIFVGNTHDAQNLDRLKQYGITHIINSTPDLPFICEKKYKYLRVDVLDLPSQNIRKYFDKAFQFIDEALHNKTNNVLVHCSAGISRSPTLVLAYMIKKYHMKLDEAFHQMRQSRQIVDPNVSFIIQLRDWESKCLMTPTTTTTDTKDEMTCNSARSTPSTYCGSTSKSNSDTKPHTDSVIVVN